MEPPPPRLVLAASFSSLQTTALLALSLAADTDDPQAATQTVRVGRQQHSVSLLLADHRVLNVDTQSASVREMRMEEHREVFRTEPKAKQARYGLEFP